MAKISLRISDTLLIAVDTKIKSSIYNSRSELIRDILRRWVEGSLLEVTIQDVPCKRR